ncbi:MAG: DHHA2 domain-containing protein [Spirochaetaceae bacterium]
MNDRSLIVVGHRNPDTDSVCSAIAYARFKEKLGIEARPYRAGNVNAQTQYVLDRFHVAPPPLLTDLFPKLSDIMIPRSALYLLEPEDSLSEALRIILDNRFAFLPVQDREGRCLGEVTALHLAGLLDELPGRSGGESVETAIEQLLQESVAEHLDPAEPTFRTGDLVRDVEQQINQYNIGGFVVNDDEGRIAGVITRMSFLEKARFRVALVDHNEFSQAVDGIEEAEVVEVIDHHRIGARSTTTPITFINRVLGSTSTIIADMYRTAGLEPEPESAALMLSAILSDTVILKSPTTTATDEEIARWLSEIAGLDLEPYGEAMFEAGSEIFGLTARQIVERDQKRYEEGGYRFAVSQIEMVSFKLFEDRQEEIQHAVGALRAEAGLDFACLMVTDITHGTTRLVYSGKERVGNAIQYPTVAPGIYEMKDVLSRKKQVLPYLIDLLGRL